MREQGPAVVVRFENNGCASVDLAADPDGAENRLRVLRVSAETWGREDLTLPLHVFSSCSCSV